MNFTATFRIAMLLAEASRPTITGYFTKKADKMLIGIKCIFQKISYATPSSFNQKSSTLVASELLTNFTNISSNIYHASRRTMNYLEDTWKALKTTIINEKKSSNHLKEQLIQEEQLFDAPELQDSTAPAPITATAPVTAPATAPVIAPATAPAIAPTTASTTTTAPISRTWASILAPNSQSNTTNILSPHAHEGKKEVARNVLNSYTTTTNSIATNSTATNESEATLKTTIYSEIQFKTEAEILDEDSSTDIYKIIIKLATNNETGQLSELVSLEHLSNIILAKNYTLIQLNTCIYEYECLNIWYTTDETLSIRSKKCKKNNRSKGR